MWETQCNTSLTGEGMNDIEPCPKCKKKEGFDWHYAKDSSMTGGYGVCNACGAKFK